MVQVVNFSNITQLAQNTLVEHKFLLNSHHWPRVLLELGE